MPRTARRRFALVRAAAAAVCLALCCGCAQLAFALPHRDTVALITGCPPAGFAGVDTAAFCQRLQAQGLRVRCEGADGAQALTAAVAAAAADPDTAVLVVELDKAGYAPAVVALAAQQGLPLLLYGAQPNAAQLAGWDSCWYVGFDAALALELQARLAAQAHDDGLIEDMDGDFRRGSLTVCTFEGLARQHDPYAAGLAAQMELGGLHTGAAAGPLYGDADALAAALPQLLGWPPAADDAQPADAQRRAVELAICGDALASEAVLAALPEQGAPAVVCFGGTQPILDAVAQGRAVGTVLPDVAAATDALCALAGDLAAQRPLAQGTDYHFAQGRYLMLEYTVLSAPKEG